MIQYANVCSTTRYVLLKGRGGVSRSKTCREAGSAGRSSHRSAVTGAAACRPSPVAGSAGHHDPKGRQAMARRCGRGLRGGGGRRYAPGEVATLPPTARPCRAAGDGGRAVLALGTAAAPKPAHAAPPAPGNIGAGAARAGISDRPADRWYCFTWNNYTEYHVVGVCFIT